MHTIYLPHIGRLRWRHWLLIALLAIVTIIRSSHGLGLAYTTHVYPVIGGLLSPVSGFMPFAISDIFIALSIAWVMLYPVYEMILRKRLAKRYVSLRPRNGQYKKKRAVLARVAEYLLWVYVWFYVAWGLNYSQPNIYRRIGMSPVEVNKARLKAFACQYADSLNKWSEGCGVKSEECGVKNEERGVKNEECGVKSEEWGVKNEERGVKSEESKWLRGKGNDDEEKEKWEKSILQGYYRIGGRGINAPFNLHPHVKTMVFTPLSSMAGVTGSMGPFFCEFTLNGDLRPHEYPATYAHEFAHFLGVANEGEANFYSYIVCTASADMAVRFSGYYSIFFQVLNNVFDILGEKEGAAFLKRIRPEIIQLAKSDRRYWLGKRSKLLNAAQDIMLDLYLRGNNVAEGRKSYSQVIALILAWEEKAESAQCPSNDKRKREFIGQGAFGRCHTRQHSSHLFQAERELVADGLLRYAELLANFFCRATFKFYHSYDFSLCFRKLSQDVGYSGKKIVVVDIVGRGRRACHIAASEVVFIFWRVEVGSI